MDAFVGLCFSAVFIGAALALLGFFFRELEVWHIGLWMSIVASVMWIVLSMISRPLDLSFVIWAGLLVLFILFAAENMTPGKKVKRIVLPNKR